MQKKFPEPLLMFKVYKQSSLFCLFKCFACIFFFSIFKDSLEKSHLLLKWNLKGNKQCRILSFLHAIFNTEYQQCKLAFRTEERAFPESHKTLIETSKRRSQPLRQRWIVLHISAKYKPVRAQQGWLGTRVMVSQQRTKYPCQV